MNAIHLQPVLDGPGRTPEPFLDRLDLLAADLARAFRVNVHVRVEPVDASFALFTARHQFHSTAILKKLADAAPGGDTRLLGVTPVDLFVPVLTFVFGEGQLEGRCALVSTQRLQESFYGLPDREELFRERLLKEAMHELGHTFGLRHCDDWNCVMASTHGVERLDIKQAAFCRECARAVR